MADEQPVTPDRTCSFCTRTSGWNKIITSAATQVSICDTCIITMLEQWLLEPKATDRKEVEKLRADNKALLAMIANIGAVMNGSKIQT